MARRQTIAIIGIEIGTQSLKAMVTDHDLVPLGRAAIAYRPDYPRPGCAEQHPRLWEAALEDCAFAMRDVVERLIAFGVTVEGLLLGGGARSRVWAQIRPDFTGLPVDRPALTDTSPLGAAIFAAVAGGLQTDIPSCAARVYDDAYGAYALLFDSLRPMFEHAAPRAAPGPVP